MSGEATNEIYIFFTSQVKLKTYSTKTFEFSFYYKQQREENFNIHKLTLISTQEANIRTCQSETKQNDPNLFRIIK